MMVKTTNAHMARTVDVRLSRSVHGQTGSMGALLAVPARVRGLKGSGDAVTVEFTFDPEEDDV